MRPGAVVVFHLAGALRAFYRSRLVDILLASLVHAALAERGASTAELALAGSALATCATVGLVAAFSVEDTAPALRSPVGTLSLYAITAAAGRLPSRESPEALR